MSNKWLKKPATKIDSGGPFGGDMPRQYYKIGDHLISKDANGICDKIEWSNTFQTWCYHVGGAKPYWIYQTEPTLHKFGKRPLIPPPTKAPYPPRKISE